MPRNIEHDKFVQEIVRRIKATAIGARFQTTHGCVSLTADEKYWLAEIARGEGLTLEQLINQYF